MESAAGINYEILYGDGAFAMLRVLLRRGMSIKAQSDAMVTMDTTMEVEGKLEGGILGGLGRLLLSNENFFFQTITAVTGDGETVLAPAFPGSVLDLEMDGTPYYVQKGGFFAATEGVTISTKMQNLAKGLFGGGGLFVLEASGHGILFVETFGAVHVVDIPAGKDIIIDNNHLVAWPKDIQYNLQKASKGWLSSVTSGEMLVFRFKGPGRVLIQSRNNIGFSQWIGAMFPSK
ncbi:MAG: TIGR00266 family protein [Synergistaceae bacterium]|nr:TIGR00266 family protein [Synergistaceae bacterium]